MSPEEADRLSELAVRRISDGLRHRLEALQRRSASASPTQTPKELIMSASLSKRVAALEAQVPGAVVPTKILWRPYAMAPDEEAAWEADLAARKAANPRQNFMIFGWGDPQ